ncbi:MAG TPA: phage integrase SAM-like domain-containing protein, partial [Bacteroidia bacterium]
MKHTTANLPKIIYRTDQPKKDGSCTFYLQIHFNGKKYFTSLGIFCKPEYYDAKNNRVKKSHPLAESFNDTILKLFVRASNIVLEAKTATEALSIKWFMDKFHNNVIDQKENDFYSFVENEIELQKKKSNLASQTIKKNIEQNNKLKRFAPKLDFNDITERFLADYEEYMREVLGNKKGGSSNSLKFIRKFLYVAIKKGLTQN